MPHSPMAEKDRDRDRLLVNTDATNCLTRSDPGADAPSGPVDAGTVMKARSPSASACVIPNADTYFMAPSLAEKLTWPATITWSRACIFANYMHFTLEYPNMMRRMHELHIKEFTTRSASDRKGRLQIYDIGGRLERHLSRRGHCAAEAEQEPSLAGIRLAGAGHGAAFRRRAVSRPQGAQRRVGETA